MKNFYLKIIYQILAIYARRVLAKHRPIIIGITGSVGKTTTKEAVFSVLHEEFGDEVRKNHGNLNTEIGVPLTILGYTKLPNKFAWPVFLMTAYFRTLQKNYPKYLILEMSVDKPGDMDYLTSIAKPDYAIVTSTKGAHLANFSDEKQYQQEKMKIIEALNKNGKAIVNFDDEVLNNCLHENIFSFAIENKADYRAEDIKLTLKGTEYRIVCTGYKIAVKSKLLGRHLIYGQLAAFALGDILGISRLKVGKSLELIVPMPGRMNLIEGKRNSIIIDDTYNSCNPSSVEAAVRLLSEIEYSGRKVVILGNINELGNNTKGAHQEVGSFVKDKCDLAIFVGPNASIMQKSYNNNETSLVFQDRNSLIKALPKVLEERDLVLIKASQNGNYFEEVTKAWMSEPSQAEKLLVRQSKFWKNKK